MTIVKDKRENTYLLSNTELFSKNIYKKNVVEAEGKN